MLRNVCNVVGMTNNNNAARTALATIASATDIRPALGTKRDILIFTAPADGVLALMAARDELTFPLVFTYADSDANRYHIDLTA